MNGYYVTIDTNGGIKVIPFKVSLKNYESKMVSSLIGVVKLLLASCGSFISKEASYMRFSFTRKYKEDILALQQLRLRPVIVGSSLGALFGFLLYYLIKIQLFSLIIVGVAGIISFIMIFDKLIVKALKLAYKQVDDDLGFAVFKFLCGALVVCGLLISLVEFPHFLSTIGWALIFGALNKILSRPIR